MGLILWVILRLLAGLIAKFVMPGKDPGGVFLTIIIGIIGAFIAGLSARHLDSAEFLDSISATCSSRSVDRFCC